MRIFLICPVRYANEEQTRAITEWVRQKECLEGETVHWPARDTLQTQTAFKICEENRFAMEHSDEVHVWYDPTSQGSVFDIGMAFVMGKPVFLVNPEAVQPTESKSYNNLVIALDEKAREWKRIVAELNKIVTGEAGYFEHEEGHRMRVPTTREERKEMLAEIKAEKSESEIEDELRGMPYDETLGQDAATPSSYRKR